MEKMVDNNITTYIWAEEECSHYPHPSPLTNRLLCCSLGAVITRDQIHTQDASRHMEDSASRGAG